MQTIFKRYQRVLFISFSIFLLSTVTSLTALSNADSQSDVTAPNVIGLPTMFKADLSGAAEVPAVSSTASGLALFALSSDEGSLHYHISVNNITDITAAHIHIGAVGENGDVVFPLYDGTGAFDPANPIQDILTVDAAQLADLKAGNFYVNVHTSTNPPGEVRGQVELYTASSNFHALLSGANEVPAVETGASGIAHFVLSDSGLEYTISVANIVDITAAHIHTAPSGANGGVAFGLFDGTGSFDPDNPINGTLTVEPQTMLDLLTGNYYVNVHTTANGSGEVRGQIGGVSLYQSNLSGANEVPAVETSASGEAVLALSADGTTLHYQINVADITEITAAHIHVAPAGENGDVAFGLFDGTGDFDPDNPISGEITLTDADAMALVAGNYYINVHTAANASGEIRGQIGQFMTAKDFNAALSGAAEVPAVESSAGGLARFHLNMPTDQLQYNISVSDITDITAAHIHAAPSGANGGVAFGLFDGTGTFTPDSPISGAITLGAADLVNLLTRNYYVNVHTTANPSGEVRGQVDFGLGAPTGLDIADEPTVGLQVYLPWIGK